MKANENPLMSLTNEELDEIEKTLKLSRKLDSATALRLIVEIRRLKHRVLNAATILTHPGAVGLFAYPTGEP